MPPSFSCPGHQRIQSPNQTLNRPTAWIRPAQDLNHCISSPHLISPTLPPNRCVRLPSGPPTLYPPTNRSMPNHPTAEDLVAFLSRAKGGLTPDGKIFIKENVCTQVR